MTITFLSEEEKIRKLYAFFSENCLPFTSELVARHTMHFLREVYEMGSIRTDNPLLHSKAWDIPARNCNHLGLVTKLDSFINISDGGIELVEELQLSPYFVIFESAREYSESWEERRRPPPAREAIQAWNKIEENPHLGIDIITDLVHELSRKFPPSPLFSSERIVNKRSVTHPTY